MRLVDRVHCGLCQLIIIIGLSINESIDRTNETAQEETSDKFKINLQQMLYIYKCERDVLYIFGTNVS